MIKSIFYLFILTNFLFSWDNSDIEYIIYTNNSMIESANNLSNLHENLVDDNFKLKTKIILNDTLSTSFHNYINNSFYK